MNPIAYLINRLRVPLRVRITGPADRNAAALRGIAELIRRRPDMNGRRIRIDLIIREKQEGER